MSGMERGIGPCRLEDREDIRELSQSMYMAKKYETIILQHLGPTEY